MRMAFARFVIGVRDLCADGDHSFRWRRSNSHISPSVSRLMMLRTSEYTLLVETDHVTDDSSINSIKFAPTDEVHGKFTVPLPKAPRHPDTLSEHITQGPFGRKSQSSPLPSSLSSLAEEVSGPNKGEGVDSDQHSISDAETIRPASPPPKKLDKGKGKAIDPPLPASLKIPQSQASLDVPEGSLVTLAGIPFAGDALPELLKRAKSQLPLRPIRIPILGEYEDTFTGADFTTWLKDNVPAFEGNVEHAEAAARDLTERDNLLRRIGDLGKRLLIGAACF